MCHVQGREVLTGLWCGNLTARGHSEVLRLDYKVILKWNLKKSDEGANWSRVRKKLLAVECIVMNLQVA